MGAGAVVCAAKDGVMQFRNFAIELSLVVVVALLAAPAFAAKELPAPTGPHGVGRTLMHIKDDDRAETWTDDPKDKRELPLMIWYPAQVPAGTPLAEYLPYPPDKVRGGLAIERGRGRALTIHTYADVPAADGKFPVLLFSAGSGSGPAAYTALIEGIVSHGFVVVGMDHTYEGAGQILGDGRRVDATTESFRPEGDPATPEYAAASRAFYLRRVAVRSADAGTVVGTLRMLNTMPKGRFNGRLDLDRIGVFGHSLGGVAAAHALMDVGAIKAGVNIDGHMSGLGFDEAHTPNKPFMMIEAPGQPPADEDLARWNISRAQYEEDMRKMEGRQAEAYGRNATVSYRVTIDAADHGNFSDDIFLMPDKDGTMATPRVEIMENAREFIVEFFGQTLSGRPAPQFASPPAGTRVEAFGGAAD